MTPQEVREDLARMTGYLSSREAKYRRNYNRYANNGIRMEDLRTMYGTPNAWWGLHDDTSSIPIINATRSCIDSQISKLSQTRVRPFLNPLSGTYRTRQVCRAGQKYFDQYYDVTGVYRKGIDACRDAEIFEIGWAWADEETRQIYQPKPWEVLFDPAEVHYGRVIRGALCFDHWPVEYIIARVKSKLPVLAAQAERDCSLKCKYEIYWNLARKEKHYFINGQHAGMDKIEYSALPLVPIWFSPPVKSGKSVSLVDLVFPLQIELDDIVERIHAAAAINPGNMAFIPKGSNIKPSMVSNEFGAVYEYQPVPDAGQGQITIATPRFIDPQYFQAAAYYEQKIYEMTGTSQLSAQAKKPAGADSGKALETLEDVESDRHNVILQSLIKFYMDLANVIIEVFPEGEDILPDDKGKVKWRDLKRERKAYRIQFSATSALSKDPKTKLEQIEKMVGMGLIKPEVSASLMEMPDLEDAYSIATAAYDDAQKIIERVIETGKMDFYEAVPLQLMLLETTNTLARLDANDEKQEILERLSAFLGFIVAKQQALQAQMQPPQPLPAAIPGAPAQAPIQAPAQALPQGGIV